MSTSAASRRSSIAPKHPSTFINGTPFQKPSLSRQPSVPSSPSLPRTISASKVPQKLNMAAAANGAVNSVVPRAKPIRKKALTATQQAAKATPPVPVHASPFEIMAARIANRVAEMAENISFVERPLPRAEPEPVNGRKPPRKLEIRFPPSTGDVQFSAPFLDNTLAKMLHLQNRMLKTGTDLAASDAPEVVKKEQFEQSAELSRIIALICAEKARQGA